MATTAGTKKNAPRQVSNKMSVQNVWQLKVDPTSGAKVEFNKETFATRFPDSRFPDPKARDEAALAAWEAAINIAYDAAEAAEAAAEAAVEALEVFDSIDSVAQKRISRWDLLKSIVVGRNQNEGSRKQWNRVKNMLGSTNLTPVQEVVPSKHVEDLNIQGAEVSGRDKNAACIQQNQMSGNDATMDSGSGTRIPRKKSIPRRQSKTRRRTKYLETAEHSISHEQEQLVFTALTKATQPQGRPPFAVIMWGGIGVGKTTASGKLLGELGVERAQMIDLDVDELVQHIPAFRSAIGTTEEQTAYMKYREVAKKTQMRLGLQALKQGFDVYIEWTNEQNLYALCHGISELFPIAALNLKAYHLAICLVECRDTEGVLAATAIRAMKDKRHIDPAIVREFNNDRALHFIKEVTNESAPKHMRTFVETREDATLGGLGMMELKGGDLQAAGIGNEEEARAALDVLRKKHFEEETANTLHNPPVTVNDSAVKEGVPPPITSSSGPTTTSLKTKEVVVTIECGVAGNNKWGGIAAVGSKLYCAPYSASSVLVIDADTDKISMIECSVAGGDKWRGIAAVGSKLYCAPHHASSVLVIDAETNKVSTIECGVAGHEKWRGIAAVGSKLYCAPYNASSVLVIDVETDKVSTIECGVAGNYKWSGIAAVGSKLYCAPFKASSVLVIDAETNKVSTIECGVAGHEKWRGIAAVGSKLYCGPYNASSVLAIDAETNKVSTIECGVAGSGPKWEGIVAAGSKLYCAPFNASSVLAIDAETNKVSTIECGVAGGGKWLGIAAVGSKLYCAPYSASQILVFEDDWTREEIVRPDVLCKKHFEQTDSDLYQKVDHWQQETASALVARDAQVDLQQEIHNPPVTVNDSAVKEGVADLVTDLPSYMRFVKTANQFIKNGISGEEMDVSRQCVNVDVYTGGSVEEAIPYLQQHFLADRELAENEPVALLVERTKAPIWIPAKIENKVDGYIVSFENIKCEVIKKNNCSAKFKHWMDTGAKLRKFDAPAFLSVDLKVQLQGLHHLVLRKVKLTCETDGEVEVHFDGFAINAGINRGRVYLQRSSQPVNRKALRPMPVLITGPAASGKTTLTKQYVYTLASEFCEKSPKEQSPLVPLRVPFIELEKAVDDGLDKDLLSVYLRGNYPSTCAELLLKMRDERRLIVFLDGINETTGDKCDILKRYVSCRLAMEVQLCVTGRENGIEATDLFRSFINLQIKPLTEVKIKHIVKAWLEKYDATRIEQRIVQFMEKLRENRFFMELAKNPLLLNLLVLEEAAQLDTDAISFQGRCVPGQKEYVASFPGIHKLEWDRVTKVLKEKSVACVFIAEEDPQYGEHDDDPENPGRCFCESYLYKDPWPGKEEQFILEDSNMCIGKALPAMGKKVEALIELHDDKKWWVCTVEMAEVARIKVKY
jgi:adenylylsulfate kinase-like enzyme